MKYDDGYRSDYVDDRRGASGGGGMGSGGIALLFMLFRRFGFKGLLVGLLIFGALWYCGGGTGVGLSQNEASGDVDPADEPLVALVSVTLDDAQAVWTKEFDKLGKRYPMARLQLFSDSINSACGRASASTGPFYCPGDQQVYIDLGFYRVLKDRLGAPGDFAQAYVIAHEVGHHVQHQLGALEHRGKGADGGSVRVELQADCYAGIWAHNAKDSTLVEIEAGDLEEALEAAAAIGDDALQGRGGGTVRPETFSHGTSAQRAQWFRVGFDTGDPSKCDTFNATRL